VLFQDIVAAFLFQLADPNISGRSDVFWLVLRNS